MHFYLTNSAEKELEKIQKGDKKSASRIKAFWKVLEKTDNLKTLPNARKLSGLKDSWRFRIGDYRIESRILKIENGLEITEIISIAKLSKKDEILEIYKIAYRQVSYKDQKNPR